MTEAKSVYHTTRRIAREQYTLRNRILSILADATFVNDFCALFVSHDAQICSTSHYIVMLSLPVAGDARLGQQTLRRVVQIQL